MDDETEPTRPTLPVERERNAIPVPTGDEIDAATAKVTPPVQSKRKKPRKLRHKRRSR